MGLLSLLLAAPLSAANKPPHPKLDRPLQQEANAGSTARQRVIIRTKPGYRTTIRNERQAHGDRIRGDHALIDAFTADVRGDELEALANNPAVAMVSADATVMAHGVTQLPAPPVTLRSALGLTTPTPFTAPTVQGLVGVAVIDSGIRPSIDFANQIVGFFDFTKGAAQPSASAAYDDYGHGTHVAGLIGGAGTLSSGKYQGVAPSVTLTAMKVLDANGLGRTSDVINALAFATANKTRYGIDVINLSLGHPIYEPAATDPLVQAVEAASRAGIVVVVAAGNFGTNPQPARLAMRGSRRRATRPLRSPSGRRKPTARSHPATTALQTTVPGARAGTTALRNQTSSRRAIT